MMKDGTKRQTVTGVTTERLRQLIMNGELGAGEAIRQDELSSRLGVSRTPLREAIMTLQAEGLVVSHPHRGTTVCKPTAEDLEEIYEIRLLLEPHTACLAARRGTPQLLAELDEIVQQMDSAETPWRLIQLRQEFNHRFYSASGKKVLVDLVRSLSLRAEPYVNLLVGGSRKPFTRAVFVRHLEAIRDCDGDKAAEATRAHLEMTVANVLPMLRR